MYIFVRVAAILLIILGVVFMLAGLGGSVYSMLFGEAVTDFANQFLAGQPFLFVNFGTAGAVIGLVIFFKGLLLSALGQLMLVLVDLSNHAKETNVILRSFKRS
jgi:hypothetical protein